MTRRFLATVALAAIAASGSLPAAQDGALRYRWTAGETTRYRVTQQTNSSMTVPGMGDMTVTNTIVSVQKFDVGAVAADGSATVRVQTESIRMDTATPMGTMTYDSTSPEASAGNPMAEMMRQSMGLLIGETVTLHVAPSGRISQVEGLKAIADKMQKAGPAAAAAMPGGMAPTLGEDALRSMFDQSFLTLPDRAVKAGDTWTFDNKVTTPGGVLNTSTRLTLKAAETQDGRALLRIGTSATQTPVEGTGTTGPVGMRMGAGTSEGEALIDARSGRLQRYTVNQAQPMSITMQGPDGSPMNIESLTRTTTTIELLLK